MKKIAFLSFALMLQLGYAQKSKNFETKISHVKTTSGEGCLTTYYGPWPEATFTPTCEGREEEIHTSTGFGTYANVNVTAGIEYSFITYSSLTTAKTAFVTIANEEGTLAYASGYDIVKWTPTKDEVVRFYAHADNQCGMPNESVKKFIRCGAIPPEPTYGCDQNYDGPYWAACSVSGEADYLAADDFFVPKDSEAFKLKSLKYLLLPLAAEEDFKKFTIKIRKDNNNSPGEAIATFENLVATETTLHTEDFMGFPTYWTTLTLPNGGLEIPANKEENTRYWISLQVWSKTEQNIFLAGFHRINGWLTAPTFQGLDGNWVTTTYEEDPGLESIWSFDADCNKLAVNESSTGKSFYYPNPVKDILNLNSKQAIKEVAIFSFSGQKLLTKKDLKNQQINVSSLVPGTYAVTLILENGTTETFKIIKK